MIYIFDPKGVLSSPSSDGGTVTSDTTVSFFAFGVGYSTAKIGDIRSLEDGRLFRLLVDELGTTVWSEISGLSTTSKLLIPKLVTVTSTLDIESDIFLVDATLGNIVITLPNVDNKVINIYRDDDTINTVTFTDTISDDSTFGLLLNENITVIKINSKWRII